MTDSSPSLFPLHIHSSGHKRAPGSTGRGATRDEPHTLQCNVYCLDQLPPYERLDRSSSLLFDQKRFFFFYCMTQDMCRCAAYRRLVLHSARDRVRGGSLNALVDFIETISTPGLYPTTSHNSSICPVCGCVSQFDCESFSFLYILSPSRLYSIVFEFLDGFLLERI